MRLVTGFILFICCYSSTAFAQYAVSDIPKELLSRASATVRLEEMTIHMKAPNDVDIMNKTIITVHNKAGEKFAEQTLGYDKVRQIKSAKGEILDEDGKVIRKFGLKDFKDYSASGSSTLYSDSRVKVYQPMMNNYPYTLAIEYEYRYKQSFGLPAWILNYQEGLSVEKSIFKFTAAESSKLRINEKNCTVSPKVEKNGKTQSYTWTFENMAANRVEPYSPIRRESATIVEVMPEEFQYYQFAGKISDWQSFGTWYNSNLVKDKRNLPPATVAQIKQLTADMATPKEKAKALYKFLQTKTRYISVQIGIGGHEPFPAEQVDRVGYGDCKALANYMQALLDVVEIPSYYAIVTAGNQQVDFDPNFASLDGNHAIVCIPFENDTTWLECTSTNYPFGYLGDFTDNRLVLAVTKDGGKIMRTASYSYDESLQHRKSNLTLDASGKLSGSLSTLYKGNQFDNHFSNYHEHLDEQKKSLRQQYDIDRIEFTEVKYNLDADKIELTEELQIDIPRYGIVNGNSLTLHPNIFNRGSSIPEIVNRKRPVRIYRGYTDIDEIEIELPNPKEQHILPYEKKLEVPMATYHQTVSKVDGKLKYYRKVELKEGTFPVESYVEFSKFMREVQASDGIKFNLTLVDKK